MTKAEIVYQKITGYANYSQMNGIEKSWIIKCIDDALKEQLNIGGVVFNAVDYLYETCQKGKETMCRCKCDWCHKEFK